MIGVNIGKFNSLTGENYCLTMKQCQTSVGHTNKLNDWKIIRIGRLVREEYI